MVDNMRIGARVENLVSIETVISFINIYNSGKRSILRSF